MNYVITIDKERCIGCGLCEHRFPDLFQIGRDHAELKIDSFKELPDEITRKRLKLLSEECPSWAIILPSAFSKEER
jgi:ferredoxin